MFYIVHFHADGGQACIPGRRVFSSSDAAKRFAKNMENEPGHLCKNCVNIEVSDTNPGDYGSIYRPGAILI